jgi:hypothetical protein
VPRIADGVRSLAEEPNPAAARVQAGAHAVAVLGGRRDAGHRRQRQATDPPKGVLDDLRLDRELARIRDVAVQTATARRIHERPAIRDASSTSIVSPYTTPLATRSMRARTRSPGIAPPTSTIRPSSRAIMRPPAAGFSMVRVTTCPGVIIRSAEASRSIVHAEARRFSERCRSG